MVALVSTGGSLEFLSSSRQLLLVAIKNRGEATTEELSRETYLSPGAVRQHLLALEAQGLVSYLRMRNGPGRPRHVFRLTGHGEELFPQLYSEIANVLFSAIEAEDEAVLERVFKRLVEEQVGLAAQRVQSMTRPERLLELVQLIENYGYFPRLEVVDNGPASLTLRHCPLLKLAQNHAAICEVECSAMKSVLPGASIERTAHRLNGDSVCCYEIRYE
jgi:DeoR family suf operon transcriptional repressor